jgi:hypothetical protein
LGRGEREIQSCLGLMVSYFPEKRVTSRDLVSLVRYNMVHTGLRSGNSRLRSIFQYFITCYVEEEQLSLLYAVS